MRISPLRSFIVCKNCGRPITGSGCKGNGGKYYYYHCQTAAACKERFRADVAHEVFVEMLKGISAKEEILALYYRIMSEYFKKNGIDKTRQMKELQVQIEKFKQRIANAQALMPDAELTTAEYRDIRNTVQSELELLERKKVQLITCEDDFQQYLDKDIPLLQNIDKHWLSADLEGKQRIVGSIFSEKLIFEKASYRTTKANPALALIAAVGVGSSSS